MRRTTVALLLALLAAPGCKRRHLLADDKVAMVAESDPEMLAAMATAKARIGDFWRRFDKPTDGEARFAVKVPVTDANGTEYFWLGKLTRAGGMVTGTVDNDPNIVQTVKMGQRLEVPEDSVVDWLYMRNRKMYGNYTVWPLLKTMDPAEARQLKALLAEPDPRAPALGAPPL